MLTPRPTIDTCAEMEEAVLRYGLLPLLPCGIPGFSIREMTRADQWFGDEPGPWEWKGPVIREMHCAYGKIFHRKAGFVSLEWLPDMVNYRRSCRLAPNDDAAALDDVVLQTIAGLGSATIKDLRRHLGLERRRRRRADDLVDTFSIGEKVNLEPSLQRLQMQMRIVIADFEYNIDRHGRAYGWGIARYATPEALYGNIFHTELKPLESLARLYGHLHTVLPHAKPAALRRLLECKHKPK